MRLVWLLLLALPASAQQRLIVPSCAAAAASVVGSAGGTVSCETTVTTTIVVPPTGITVACQTGKDNSASIKAAIDAARPLRVPVLIPAGICTYGDVINLDGVKMIGKGDSSVLFSTNVQRAAIFLRGSGSELRSVKLDGVAPTARLNPYEGWRVVAFGASQWVVDNVTIVSSAAVGIGSTRAASHGVISNNRVIGTMADSIHMTDKSSYITLHGNRIENSGDDGIAVVSYRAQGNPVHHITAVGNLIANNKWGRSMSVVGGEDVLYENNRMSNSGVSACLYLAKETNAAYDTLPIGNVIARNNTLTNCGNVGKTGHAAVMAFSNGPATNDNVLVQRNDIIQTGTQSGIRAFGPQTRVVIDSNRIQSVTPLVLPADIVAVPYTSGAVGAR